MKIYHLNGSEQFFDIISEPSNRAATSVESFMIELVQHNVYCKGTTSLQFLDEPYKMLYSGIDFIESSPFLKAFDEMLIKMEANGMMDYWRQHRSFSTTKIEEIGPQVLTMDHLKFGFLACCIPMALAVIAFIGELALSRFLTSGRNSNDSRKSNQKAKGDAKIFSSKFNQIQPQTRNAEPEELIEMYSTAKINQEFQFYLENMIKRNNDDDLVCCCQELLDEFDKSMKPNNTSNVGPNILSSDFRTQPQIEKVEPEELIGIPAIAVAETLQEDLIECYDDDDLLRCCLELLDDDLADDCVVTKFQKNCNFFDVLS